MKDLILWNLWYGMLVTLPSVITTLLIKSVMVSAVARRRRPSSINRREEVGHVIF